MTGTNFVLVPERSVVDALIVACPFLTSAPEFLLDEGPTVVFGDVARLIKKQLLSEAQIVSVFGFFSELATTGNDEDLTVLMTGALETFNDDAASQRLARMHLQGAALTLLEEARVFFGQPDFPCGKQA